MVESRQVMVFELRMAGSAGKIRNRPLTLRGHAVGAEGAGDLAAQFQIGRLEKIRAGLQPKAPAPGCQIKIDLPAALLNFGRQDNVERAMIREAPEKITPIPHLQLFHLQLKERLARLRSGAGKA